MDEYLLNDSISNQVEVESKGNFLIGAVGALLFSLAGVVVWFLIYQIGYIAGACGIIMLALTRKGYELFCKKENFGSIIIPFIISVAMIFVAELTCLGFEIFKTYKTEYQITILDAYRSIPGFLKDPEVIKGVRTDLIMGYFLLAGSIFFAFAQGAGKKPKTLTELDQQQ